MAHKFSRPTIYPGACQPPTAPSAFPSDTELMHLRSLLAEFTSSCCAQLGSALPPVREWLVPEKIDENKWRLRRTQVAADYYSIVRLNYDAPSFASLVQIINDSAGLRQYFALDFLGSVEHGDQARLWINSRVDFFIHEYLCQVFNASGTLAFEEAVFDELFVKLSQELTRPTLRRVAITPLLALVVRDPIDLGNGVLIRPPTSNEIERLINATGGVFGAHITHHVLQLGALLELSHDGPRSLRLIENANEIVDRVTTLLNLVMPKVVVPLYTHQFIDSICFSAKSSGLMGPYLPVDKVDVSDNEREQLIDVWKRLEHSHNLAAVATALRRFLYASKRNLQSDAFIDYIIALESVLSSDEMTEISFRLSLRLAALIGVDAPERRKIFKRTRKLYGLRSGVLHGSADEKMLTENTEELREYTRRLILRMLELRKGLDLPQIECALLATNV